MSLTAHLFDTSVWSYEIGNGNWGWGNGEIEYYTNRTDNVRVAGGSLQIIAKKRKLWWTEIYIR